MKTFKKVAILSTMIAPLMLSLTSCDDLFNPAPENFKGEEDLKEMPSWAAGLFTSFETASSVAVSDQG